MPSAGHLVSLDLETIPIDLTGIPLDEVLDFRARHGEEYAAYARQVRDTIATLAPLEAEERRLLVSDRRDELNAASAQLTEFAQPLGSVALGAAGAVWNTLVSNPVGAVLSALSGLRGAAPARTDAGAYTYLFQTRSRFPRHEPPLK